MLDHTLCWSPSPAAHGWPLTPQRAWGCTAGESRAHAWPPPPTAIAPSLPAREASCPFGRMGEMEKAPPLPWANTAPLSSYPGERNSQVPAGTVTSPPGNAFPQPAGKGALGSPKEPPGFPHPKPFPAVSILAGAGGCNFSSVGRGVSAAPFQVSRAEAHRFGVGSWCERTNYCREGEQPPCIPPCS